jgi:aerobic carbon-monoxide dehydrogenase medium subunit
VKAPRFRYLRPDSLQAALAVLGELRERASPLAGGQSLLPALNMRVASPELLVDISRLPELHGIRDEGQAIRIGAATRYAEIARDALVERHVPLLAEALALVAHVAIRNRGTLGGSLALADPAAELPACTVALAATVHVAGAGGRRSLPAEAFFTGTLSTALEAGELLEAVSFPKAARGSVSAIAELSRRRGDYALAGIAVVAEVTRDVVGGARIAYFGCTSAARLAAAVARMLKGRRIPLEATAHGDLEQALAQDLDPADSPGCSAATRVRLATVLTKRILGTLRERAAS